MCRADDVCYSSSRVVDLDEVEAEMPMMMIETDFDGELVETKTLNQLERTSPVTQPIETDERFCLSNDRDVRM